MISIPINEEISISSELSEQEFLNSEFGQHSDRGANDKDKIHFYSTKRFSLFGIKVSCNILFSNGKIYYCQFIPYIEGASWSNLCTEQTNSTLEILKEKLEQQFSISIPYKSKTERIYLHHEQKDWTRSLAIQFQNSL